MSTALSGMQNGDYLSHRPLQRSVEPGISIIGEAMLAQWHTAPNNFESITNAWRIADFRNRLTHEYPPADDELVWALAKADQKVLRRESAGLFSQLDSADAHQDPEDGTKCAC